MFLKPLTSKDRKPKYIQLAEAIVEEIRSGNIQLNQKIPSVNQLSVKLNVSRETVFKALNYLAEKGIITPSNRKGYFVQKTEIEHDFRIFFLLDKLTPFKEELYSSFVDTIGSSGKVEVFFHHHNYELFKSLITQNLPFYTHFVITTFLKEDVSNILDQIPSQKRVILDRMERNLSGNYAMVYQDFENEIYNALAEARELLKSYSRIILLAPDGSSYLKDLSRGLYKFQKYSGIECLVIPRVTEDDFQEGSVYITLNAYDHDLVEVIRIARKKNLVVGRDIGIISLNDTPVKTVLEGGITVISTDFSYMGDKAARLILSGDTNHIVNPSKLIIRNSL